VARRGAGSRLEAPLRRRHVEMRTARSVLTAAAPKSYRNGLCSNWLDLTYAMHAVWRPRYVGRGWQRCV